MTISSRAAVALIVLSASVFAEPKKLKPGFNLFSKEQDVQLGKESAAQVEAQMPVVRNADLSRYIERIGQRLAAQPEADKYPYTFKVINDPSINAFALPGGPTYVHSGLIRAADNEAQLAGVMAHEIAHVALRHGTNQASKANLIQLPAMLAGAIAGGSGSMIGQLAQLGIGLGANSVLLKFSRSAERDADILGARMMAKAGYNPLEMARFFEKLEAEGGSRGPEFLASHPNPGNRMKGIQEEIQYMARQDYNADQSQFAQAKSLAGGLPAPPAQRQGRQQASAAGQGDPRPSGQFREYKGREFALTYPGNWEAFGDQQSAMLTIAPRSGLLQDQQGGVAVAYGAMISFFFPNNERGRVDLQQGTSYLINELRHSNPQLQADRQSKRTRVGGRQALVTTLQNASPLQGQREVNMLVTVERPEGLFYMIFIAPERDFQQMQGAFETMLRSVRFAS